MRCVAVPRALCVRKCLSSSLGCPALPIPRLEMLPLARSAQRRRGSQQPAQLQTTRRQNKRAEH